MSKLIGNKKFYKTVLSVALPIMLQNFITNFVSMLDNIMVGAVGTEEMSGVSIVNQLIFIFNLAIFGALSGVGIFTAQFFGKRDENGVRRTLQFKYIVSAIICAVGIIIFLTAGTPLISAFLHDGSYNCDLNKTLAFGKEYLAIILVGLIPFTVTQIFSSTLRETGETFAPMAIGFGAVIVNCVFNWLLIFGKLGFPEMGVGGAATATVISRFCECGGLFIYVLKKRQRFPYFRASIGHYDLPKALAVSIIKKGSPLLVNEFLWALGMSLLNMSYSFHGLAVVAGYSISSTVMNLFNIAFMALGVSIGIIAGNLLGAEKNEEAIDTARKMIAFSVFISIFIGTIAFFSGKYIPELYKTTEESKQLAAFFIRTTALFMPMNAFCNASYFTLRCGGKTLITFFFDSFYTCVLLVPTAFALYFLTDLNIHAIYPIVMAVDSVKCVVGFILVKKRVWVNNIVGNY